MADQAFFQLQTALVKNLDFPNSEIRTALRYNPESPETFSTFTRALLKKKIDPTEFFVISALFAVDVDNVYVRYAGLALRFGANPNSYINSPFDFGEEDGIFNVPIHLAKHIWDSVPRTYEESIERDFSTFGDYNEGLSNEDVAGRFQEKQRAGLDILSMMALKGLVSDAQITTASLLTQNGFNATRFANEHQDFFGSVYGSIKLDGELGNIYADEIKYFEQWKVGLQSAYGVNPDRDPRIFKYALLLDLPEILSLNDVYGVKENLRLIFFFQCFETIKLILPRMKELRVIGVSIARSQQFENPATTLEAARTPYEDRDADLQDRGNMKQMELIVIDWVVAYYNLEAFRQLLDLGVVPDYSVRSQIIRASKQICPSYPAQCQILNTMIVDFVKRGYGLDQEQLDELSFSPSTVAAVTKLYSVPEWKYQCSVREGVVNPDLREIARQVGIPINADKEQICSTLEILTKSTPAKITEAAYEVNRNRIAMASTTTADILAGRKILAEKRTLPQTGGLSIDEINERIADKAASKGEKEAEVQPKGTVEPPLCSNIDSISRPIEDYPDVDRVTYSDNMATWCFTSDNYSELLETGVNPWAISPDGRRGVAIPQEIMFEMEQKMNSLREGGLAEQPGSISQGVKRLFDANPKNSAQAYENESNRRLESFYEFVEEAEIPRERFIVLTAADFQTLADAVLDPSTRIVVDRSSSTLALRDFASAVMLDASNFGTGPQIAASLRSILL